MTNPKDSDFTEHNMNKSQKIWVKTWKTSWMTTETFLFDNLTWFPKKLCSVMTSASVCEHMWSVEGYTTTT